MVPAEKKRKNSAVQNEPGLIWPVITVDVVKENSQEHGGMRSDSARGSGSCKQKSLLEACAITVRTFSITFIWVERGDPKLLILDEEVNHISIYL